DLTLTPSVNFKDAYPWLDKLSQSVIPNTMGNEQQEQQWQQQHEYNEPLFNSDIHLSIPDESKASAALVDGAYGPKNANQPPLKPQVVGTKSKPGTRSTPEVTMSPNLGISSNFRVSMSPQLRTSSKSKFTMSLKQSLALCEIYSKWAFPSGQGLGQGSSAVHNRPLNSAPPVTRTTSLAEPPLDDLAVKEVDRMYTNILLNLKYHLQAAQSFSTDYPQNRRPGQPFAPKPGIQFESTNAYLRGGVE
ncbi:hypothetical protein H4R33_004574, partial [Dimargaris cristalligena]